METETIEEQVIPEVTEETPADNSEVIALREKLAAAEIRLALLSSGIAKEKLDEGTALAQGICKSGKSAEDAAAEIAENYPHLKATQQAIPKFSAAESGNSDGFAAIRKIFAGR